MSKETFKWTIFFYAFCPLELVQKFLVEHDKDTYWSNPYTRDSSI